MGSSLSVTPDQDSPVDAGQKSCISCEIPLEQQDLVDGIMEVLRTPLPFLEPVLKAVEITDETDTGYVVKIILDGGKLDGVGYGDGKGTDKISNWMKVKYDAATNTLVTEDYRKDPNGDWAPDASNDTVQMTATTRFLKDPLRVESFWVDKDGKRLHGQAQADFTQGFLNAVVESKRHKKVRFTPEADSLTEPGQKSVLSDPMDEHVSYDALWKVLTDWKVHLPEAEITEITPTQVHITGPGGVETPEGTLDVTFDQETGKIRKEHKIAGKLRGVTHEVFHKDPLRMEVWREDGQEKTRYCGKMLANDYSSNVDKAIDKANSWW